MILHNFTKVNELGNMVTINLEYYNIIISTNNDIKFSNVAFLF